MNTAAAADAKHAADEPAETLVVGRAFRGNAIMLGLDRPLRLGGGGGLLHPEGLPMSLQMEHQPDFVRAVAHACRDQALAGRDWYSHGAMILVAADAAGRGHAARRLARAAELPLFVVDASASRGFELSPDADPAQASAAIPAAIMAMALSGCANPVVAVEGLDEISEAADLLAPFLDPSASAHFTSERLGAVFDLSHVNWVLQDSSDIVAKRLPAGWASVVPFRMPATVSEKRFHRIVSVAAMLAGTPAGNGEREDLANLIEDLIDLQIAEIALAR